MTGKKAHRRHEVVDDDSDQESERESLNPENLTNQKTARAMLDQVLEQLPLDLRTVFVLYEIEELTTDQIAETLQIASGTVASRLRRAREKFRNTVARLQRAANMGGGS